jgi:hypothetical protein
MEGVGCISGALSATSWLAFGLASLAALSCWCISTLAVIIIVTIIARPSPHACLLSAMLEGLCCLAGLNGFNGNFI